MRLLKRSGSSCAKGLSTKSTSWLIGQLNGVELNELKATNGQFATRQEEFNKIDQTLSLESKASQSVRN